MCDGKSVCMCVYTHTIHRPITCLGLLTVYLKACRSLQFPLSVYAIALYSPVLRATSHIVLIQ